MVIDDPFVAAVAVSQLPVAAAAVTPETVSVPCPPFDIATVAVCLIAAATPVNEKVVALETRIGIVVTLRTTEIALLSGAKEEPVSVIVAVDWPVAIPLAAVTVNL